MREIPEDIRLAADAALLQANVKAHMLAEPTDPLECIALAILAERERAAAVAAHFVDGRLYKPNFPACSYHSLEIHAAIMSGVDAPAVRPVVALID